MELTFNTNGNEKQKEVCRYWVDDSVTDISYGGSKGSGKSFLGVNLIFGDALMYPDTHYFIARKELNDLRKHTIPSIHEVFDKWGLSQKYFKYNGMDNYFQMYNGSIVYLLQAKYLPSDPEYYRFGSMQMTRGWIEEAGQFEEDAKNNLMASIGRWKNDVYGLAPKLLQTCNPSKNYLYKEFYLKNKQGTLESWKRFVQALPTDNKMLPDGYLLNLERTLSANQKERLLKGNWEYDDDPSTLIDYNNILNLFTNTHVPDGTKYITADIARLGSDKAVIMVWSGFKVIDVITFETSRITDIQNAINGLKNKHLVPNSNIIADEDGVGGGVVDNCRIKGFVNNSKALNNENYVNLKTQCYYKLAEKINQNLIHISAELSNDERECITSELEYVKSYNEDSDGKMQILPKAEIKQMLGRSPDYSDALMMRMYFELKPTTKVRSSNLIKR